MVIGLKDAIKLVGICIISFCAVFVCTMFLSYNIDIVAIQDKITIEQVQTFYDAQILTSKSSKCCKWRLSAYNICYYAVILHQTLY